MSNYIDLTPSSMDHNDNERPVRIQYGDVKMQLPRLDDSTQLPTALLVAGLTVASKGWDNLTREEQLNLMGVLLAYLLQQYPKLERELDRKSGDKIGDIGRIFGAWANASGSDEEPYDPKA